MPKKSAQPGKRPPNKQKFFGSFFQKRTASLLLTLTAAATPSHPNAEDLFNKAVATDLGTNTTQAFALYRQAAEAGLPKAQLNVAVMYDSGRGTPHDPQQAALWYAAAASGGQARAAFDLGQLYAAGDGVPQNQALAQAWFTQAANQGLRAAADRQAPVPADASQKLQPPTLSYPATGAAVPSPDEGLALVWTATPAPAQASFFVQVMQLTGQASVPAYSASTQITSARMPAPAPGRYMWRVFILCPSLGRYAPSAWAAFSVT